MTLIEEEFLDYARRATPRVLTQMDRDPMSPTFGCFDRNYWHYKIRDFPSSILQQGVVVLDSILRGSIERSVSKELIESWIVGAIRALVRQTRWSGSVDEYYPYERSYPAAAFSLYAIGYVLWRWPLESPPPLKTEDWRGLRRLARGLILSTETQASNQQAAGLAGIALATLLPNLHLDAEAHHTLSDKFFSTQHPEGWFPEYGGPDFGYLTVTIDALIDFHDATGDDRAIIAIDRAVEFLLQLIGSDGNLPWTINSRNTDYVVPYGLVRAASRNPAAAWLVHQLFNGINTPEHFFNSIDDRYHCHYIFGSLVKAMPHLKKMMPAQTPKLPEYKWFEGCGYWIRRVHKGNTTVFFSANKGGLIRIQRKGEAPIIDNGWRINKKKVVWTSNWWSKNWAVAVTGESVCISGNLHRVRYFSPHPLLHLLLRGASLLTFGKIVKILKWLMIFRPYSQTGPKYTRSICWLEDHLEINDKIAPFYGASAEQGPRQNHRHVASADNYSNEESFCYPKPKRLFSLNEGLDKQYIWPNGA